MYLHIAFNDINCKLATYSLWVGYAKYRFYRAAWNASAD